MTALLVVAMGVSFAVSEPEAAVERDTLFDWSIPVSLQEDAAFFKLMREGGTDYVRIPVADMKDAPREATLLALHPGACDVLVNGVKGKMLAQDMIIDARAFEGKTGYISPEKADGRVTLHIAPDENSRVVAEFFSDFVLVEITAYGEDWSFIRLGDNAGYVRTACLHADPRTRPETANWFLEDGPAS